MYESVLVPVTEGAESGELLRHVGELAHWADAEIVVLNVADTSRDSITRAGGEEVVDALVTEGEEIVAGAGETLDAMDVEFSTDVVQGVPARTIVEYAERYGFDLIAMPTNAREGLSRYLLGSVTEKVVRLSAVPVLTAHVDSEGLTFPYDELLVPTDGSDVATRAAEEAVALAGALETSVHALAVTDDSLLSDAIRADMEREAAQAAVDGVVDAAADHDVDEVQTHVAGGAPDEVILDYVDRHDLDAVVMGSTGRRGLDRVLLGSVAEKTVRSAPVPVITVGET